MVSEAAYSTRSAKHTKKLDVYAIEKKFNHDACSAEPPRYQKMRSNKIAEINTIKKMLKILSNLGWSAPVFNAISRISMKGVDENPEPGYQLTHRMDVHTGLANYRFDMSQKVGDFSRVAIKLQIGTAWVWASFDARTSIFNQYLLPDSEKSPTVEQTYVKNLVVKKSTSVTNVEPTTDKPSARGNLEIWSESFKPRNQRKIPGADDGLFDFGDERHATKGTPKTAGCFQVHDYLNQQTVLAVNAFKARGNHDVGIGNQKAKKNNNPDWTGAKNSGKLKKRGQNVVISWYIQAPSSKGGKTKKNEAKTNPPSAPSQKEDPKKDQKRDQKRDQRS